MEIQQSAEIVTKKDLDIAIRDMKIWTGSMAGLVVAILSLIKFFGE